jgi:dipeptidyl aminopeptidase/acylaminoacyl peptidase
VFSSNRGGPFRLWQVPVAGGEPRLLPGAGDAADDPSVAASGRIAYEVWREDAELVSFDLGQPSAEPRAIASSTRFEWDAKVSPDGSRLAFISDRSGAAEVWVAARDGAQPQRLTSFAGPYTHSPRWSPDGTRLSFVSPVSGRMNLFVMAPGDASPRRIGAEDIDYLAPAWSADGESLFVGGTQVRADARDHAIWRVPVDGGVPVRVDAAGARNAQVSDDGKHLYYTKVGEPGLWRRGLTVDSSEERVIADLTPVDWNNWVVTGDAIFYVRRPAEAMPELMRFAVASQESHLVRALPRLLYKSGLWISADERELIATIVVRAESDLALVE